MEHRPRDSRDGNSQESYAEILSCAGNLARWLREIGCRGFAVNPDVLDAPPDLRTPGINATETMGDVRRSLGDCRRCRLADTRHNIVFGEGSEHARLVFVGEGPGYEEDKQGRPFVGAAGMLLDKIIAAMGLSRQDVYIANIIKCRPPKNRNPQADEIENCQPFLVRQLQVIQPAFICALGNFAARTLLSTDRPISSLRGVFHPWQDGIRIMPTYHPAYLLRNPGKKRETWEDIQKLMRAMDLHGPA